MMTCVMTSSLSRYVMSSSSSCRLWRVQRLPPEALRRTSSRKQIARDIKIHCYKYFDGDGVEPTKSFLGKLHAHDKVFEMVDIDMAYEMLKYLFAYDEGRAGRKLLARTVAGLDSVTIGNTVDHMSDADASSS